MSSTNVQQQLQQTQHQDTPAAEAAQEHQQVAWPTAAIEKQLSGSGAAAAAAAAGWSSQQSLLLTHRHSVSFSNLPVGLQQLLDISNGRCSRRSKHNSKCKTKHRHQGLKSSSIVTGDASHSAARAADMVEPTRSLVFGDLDSATYKGLTRSDVIDGSSSMQTGNRIAAAAPGGGEAFQSCMSHTEDENEDISSSSALEVSSEGSSDSSSDESSADEGVSLKSQLLLGHLLLMAAGGQATASSSSSSEAAKEAAGSADSTNSLSGGVGMPANSLPLLATHLRRAGLLPKWVHWLLQQLPNQPELYDRAFARLFKEVCRPLSRLCCASAHHGIIERIVTFFLWLKQSIKFEVSGVDECYTLSLLMKPVACRI
jgi:hypothetical protein